MKVALHVFLVFSLAGCGGVGDRAGPRGAPPESPVISSPVRESPAPSPTPRLVEPRSGLVDVRAQPWKDAELLGPRSVRLSFYGGVKECFGVDRVEVDYGREAVTVTLFTGRVPRAQVCIEIAELQAVDVRLGEPLGGREIVDGAA